MLEFTVKDSGIGIPEDKIEDVFQLIMQAGTSTTRKFDGIGLDLYISKLLAARHCKFDLIVVRQMITRNLNGCGGCGSRDQSKQCFNFILKIAVASYLKDLGG
ncbi:ATP-binding protein [Pseudobacteriovorax antillogorgiicola]|uniref:ATP-binding protein n=1 Tax=Pseudobacteriovorax antillogorgiicola TaxID=1513793 RepID=UPI001053DAAA|nr:ATP-binding protein [Pseudobacteriovorax antillogorgiicola]